MPNPGPVAPNGTPNTFYPIYACDDDSCCACVAHDETTGFFIILSVQCGSPEDKGCITGLDGPCGGSGPDGQCNPVGSPFGPPYDTGCSCALHPDGTWRTVIPCGNIAGCTPGGCQAAADALTGQPVNGFGVLGAYAAWLGAILDPSGEALSSIDYWFIACYDPAIVIPFIPSPPPITIQPCCTSYSPYSPGCCIPCSVQPCQGN